MCRYLSTLLVHFSSVEAFEKEIGTFVQQYANLLVRILRSTAKSKQKIEIFNLPQKASKKTQ